VTGVRKKFRYTPMEVAQQIGIPISKFNEQVNEGNLPKGRIGEDGRRYYTDKDLAYIRREWHSKTTVRFLLFTLPLILVSLFIVIAAFHEISEHFSEVQSEATPSPKPGFAAQPPQEVWVPGTPWPTNPPLQTPADQTYNYYRKHRRAPAQYRQKIEEPDQETVE